MTGWAYCNVVESRFVRLSVPATKLFLLATLFGWSVAGGAWEGRRELRSAEILRDFATNLLQRWLLDWCELSHGHPSSNSISQMGGVQPLEVWSWHTTALCRFKVWLPKMSSDAWNLKWEFWSGEGLPQMETILFTQPARRRGPEVIKGYTILSSRSLKGSNDLHIIYTHNYRCICMNIYIYMYILHYMILHRCKPQMSLFWIHNREESKAAFSQCASMELQDFQEMCWMVLFRGCCGKNILMVSPWKVWIGPNWASDNGWRTLMGGIEGIAESVPCSSSGSVDHRRRRIRSWSMGASAWEQRWDTQSMRPRYAGFGAEEMEELDLEPKSFFSFAHSEGSAFCIKRYWEVIYFSGMLCLAFHQLPPVQDMQSASERFVAKLPERVMRKGQVCNLAKR